MYKSFALHAHGRSAMPLPLCAGKQQTRELTPSKINTVTEYMCYYQCGEVDGQWGLMERPMEQSIIICLWDITSFIYSYTQSVQDTHILYHRISNEARPPRTDQYQQCITISSTVIKNSYT